VRWAAVPAEVKKSYPSKSQAKKSPDPFSAPRRTADGHRQLHHVQGHDLFLAIPPRHSVSDVMRRIKGRSSRKIQQEFPSIRKRYWGCHFWARGYFSTTAGNITQYTILQYLADHIEPTGVSR